METEVICISSDDESDSQKENRKNTSLPNSTETDNTLLSNAKTENLSSDDEKVEENNLKRKISQVSQEGISTSHIMEKKKKLDTGSYAVQNISKIDGESFATSDCTLQPNKDRELTTEKPQLIVKERKKISYVAYDIFPIFVSLCLQKVHDKDMKKIVNKLKRRYEELDPIYARSETFVLLLNEKRKDIMNDDKKIYVYIQEVMNEMKKRAKTESQVLRYYEAYDAVPSTSYATNSSLSVNNGAESDYEDDDEEIEDTVSRDTRRKIAKLSIAMKKCEFIIKKLEEAEVDFNDEGDSNYIKVERYKQKMVEMYNKYCELTGENNDAGRAYLRPKHISTTRIVTVDQAITNFINSKISKRNRLKKSGAFTDDLIFPDYRDILECVNRCNDKKNLSLDKRKREQMAKKAFIQLGEHLQRARRNDYWDTFSLYLENAEEDPALKDKELANKLSDNRSEGEKRLAAVFEKYVKQQEQMNNGLKAQDTETTTDEENEEESSIDDTNEEKDDLSVCSLSDEDSRDDIGETVKETVKESCLLIKRNANNAPVKKNTNNSSVERNPSNLSTVNMDRSIDEVVPRKTNIPRETDTLQERCNRNVEMKISMKENNMAILESENKTADDGKACRSIVNNIVMTAKNAISTNAKMQEDSLATCKTNATSVINRTEEDVAEVAKEDVSKGKVNPVAPMINRKEADVIMKDIAEVLVGDVAEMEVIVEEVIEMTEKVAKVIVSKEMNLETNRDMSSDKKSGKVAEMGVATENASCDKQSEEEKKPLLRVRSFAKPPTTWEDGRHRMVDKAVQESIPKVTNQIKDVIDLTNETSVSKPTPVLTKCAIQVGNKVLPLKATQTFLIPPGSNVINVKNITNNYLKVDTRMGQIITPVQGRTIIRGPPAQITTARQNQPQNASIASAKSEAKRKETILRIIQPNKAIIVKKPVIVQPTAKQINTHSQAKPK